METILLVEDDTDLRQNMAGLLADAGHSVRAAANGAEALTLLERLGLPRLILLDLMMPVMNGWQFRRKQLEDPVLAQIPVIVLTAFTGATAAAETLQPALVLRKPFDVDQLLDMVERCAREQGAPAAPSFLDGMHRPAPPGLLG